MPYSCRSTASASRTRSVTDPRQTSLFDLWERAAEDVVDVGGLPTLSTSSSSSMSSPPSLLLHDRSGADDDGEMADSARRSQGEENTSDARGRRAASEADVGAIGVVVDVAARATGYESEAFDAGDDTDVPDVADMSDRASEVFSAGSRAHDDDMEKASQSVDENTADADEEAAREEMVAGAEAQWAAEGRRLRLRL